MRRIHQIIALVALVLGLYVCLESIRLGYFQPLGPGPGFLPFWLGALLTALSLIWLVRLTIRPVEPVEEPFLPADDDDAGADPAEGPFVPRGAAAGRVLSVILATVLLPAIGEHLGFRLTMLACLLFLLGVTGRQKLPLTVGLGLAGSFGVYYVFHDLLDVYLPTARIGILQDLGL
jgi:putative tricarboxylic transport membrane protein